MTSKRMKRELATVLKFLEHAATHRQRGNGGAVDEAIADACKRLERLREALP